MRYLDAHCLGDCPADGQLTGGHATHILYVDISAFARSAHVNDDTVLPVATVAVAMMQP